MLILPQRVDSRELLVTIRDSLEERGRVAALMGGAETVAPLVTLLGATRS